MVQNTDFAGPLNEAYYLVVVDSYTKRPEILKCRKLTFTVTINFFKLFFVSDTVNTDNGTRFPVNLGFCVNH